VTAAGAAVVPTLPLEWPALCSHVRRPWLAGHRGVLPARRDAPMRDAPLGIAACAQFTQRHAFATEAQAETWRWIGPRAQNAYHRWCALRYERERMRAAVAVLRHWRDRDARQAALAAGTARHRWALYRRGMRAQAVQVARVRRALTPRGAPAMRLRQVA
jgi:hypothetical protein